MLEKCLILIIVVSTLIFFYIFIPLIAYWIKFFIYTNFLQIHCLIINDNEAVSLIREALGLIQLNMPHPLLMRLSFIKYLLNLLI